MSKVTQVICSIVFSVVSTKRICKQIRETTTQMEWRLIFFSHGCKKSKMMAAYVRLIIKDDNSPSFPRVVDDYQMLCLSLTLAPHGTPKLAFLP